MPTKKNMKPDPDMLGTGMAQRAGKNLKNRRSRLEEMEREAMGEKPKKKRKSKKTNY